MLLVGSCRHLHPAPAHSLTCQAHRLCQRFAAAFGVLASQVQMRTASMIFAEATRKSTS